MKKISEELILMVHDKAIQRFGGVSGIRDKNLFKSQCVAPYQTFMGKDLYPTLYDKAVRYLFGFAGNQVFLDGNKRTAVAVMLIFLDINGISVDVTSEELERIGFGVAKGLVSESTVKAFLAERTI